MEFNLSKKRQELSNYGLESTESFGAAKFYREDDVKEFIRLLREIGCDTEVDVIEDENGDGDLIICGEYVIRKSNGERVLRLCDKCKHRNKIIDKLAGDKLK